MKFAAVISVTFGGAASALNHFHGHVHRAHPRAMPPPAQYVVEEYIEVTVLECWLDGQKLTPEQCDQGVKNGTLVFLDHAYVKDPPNVTETSTVLMEPTLQPVVIYPSEPPTSSSASLASSPAPPVPPALPAAGPTTTSETTEPAKPTVTSSDGGYSSDDISGVSKEFPDGQIDCSAFPSEYGAVALPWLNIGGWASVQKPNEDDDAGFNDILTVTKAQCVQGNCCLDDAYCSYACPNGYLKSQWPAKQGATGQSIGGLYCKDGKLHLSKPDEKFLCVRGNQNPKVNVKNTLGQNVAICRTNYPGDEGMYIPVDVNPGEMQDLACPDGATYFKTEDNQQTSAQYYINMPGYPVEKACTWGSQGDDFGNFAPANLGVGFSDGRAWISIFANHPTQMVATLPYTVEIIGGSSKCRYQNGMYCTGDDYSACSDQGCTVSAASGELTYILS